MGRIDPEVEVEVLDDGEWRRGFAILRQQTGGEWWYDVRLRHPITTTRFLFVRFPDGVRLPAE